MADIGAKIGIEGEKKFREELKQITQQGKTLAAEMDNVSSSFKNADESEKDLSSVTKKLNEQVENQRKLVDKLREAVQRSSEKTGENSTETLKWKEKLAKAEKGLNDLEKKAKDAANGVDILGEEEEETSKQTSIFGDILKANLASEAIKKGLELTVTAVKEIAKFFVDAVKGAAEYADEINTLAKTTGMSTDALQEYKYMAELLDVDLSTITSSMTKMEKAMASDAKAFEELGVSTRDENGNLRDANEVFDDTLKALKEIENPVERDTKAMEIFGKSAKELNPLIETSAEDFDALRKEAHDVGAVLDKDTLNTLNNVQDCFDRLKKAWDALKKSLGAKLGAKILPDLERIVKLFQDFVKTGDIEPVIDGLSRALKNFVKKIKDDLPKIAKNLGKALGSILGNLPELIKAGAELGGALLKGLLQAIPEIGRSFARAINNSLLSDSTIDAISKIEDLSNTLADIPNKFDRMGSSIADVNAKQREAEHWIEIFDELSKKTNPTATDTAKLQTAVDKLNELYPELGLSLDKNTGKWNLNTEEIRKNIEALDAKYRAEAYYSAASDTLKEIAAIEAETRSLRQNTNALKNAIDSREAIQKIYQDEYNALYNLNAVFVSGEMSLDEYATALQELGYSSVQDATSRMNELSTAIKNNGAEIRNMKAEYEAGSKTLDEADAKLRELNNDVEWFFDQGATWGAQAEKTGEAVAMGVAKGIDKGTGAVTKASGSLMQSAISRMKNVAQIASPSKVTENLIGKNLALGVIKGWDDVFDSANMKNAFSMRGAIAGMQSTTNNTTNLGGVSVNVYATPNQDANAIARQVMAVMQNEYNAKKAVFA